MGSVYAAVDLPSGQALAIKRMLQTEDKKALALFEREYQTLAGLRHPSIVEVYEYGRDREGAFYTMELIDGADLSRAAPLPWREVCRLVRDTASALGLLHARQLLHRDLSPRNLLRTQAGRLKLIDFGALAPFGPNSQIVGTPPFVAPEALRALPLDQRTDVFGLGALAYWLLTGAHAFPAKQLSELPSLWERERAVVSELLRRHEIYANDPVPEELDELLSSMLRVDQDERLRSCADVVDRLTSIAELEPEAELLAAQGYLDSRAYIERGRERERALALLEEARQGAVRCLVIEGERGMGRSRFLRQLAIGAAVVGAIPVVANEHPEPKPFGIAESLLLGLRRALPVQFARAAAAYHGELGALSVSLFEGAQSTVRRPPSSTGPDARLRLMTALREVIHQVASDQTLMLLVDDVQGADEESLALLLSLARDEGLPLMLALALAPSAKDLPYSLQKLCDTSHRFKLSPLDRSGVLQLLGSVFGEVNYVERLSERIYEICQGNPAHCLEIVQHLIQSGEVTYRNGIWSLPTELPQENLPKNRHIIHVARLEHLSTDARSAAQLLSVAQGAALPLDECCVLLQTSAEQVLPLFEELERAGVLRTWDGMYRLRHAEVQALLYDQLDVEARARSHLRLALTFADSRSRAFDRLRACFHFMRGGDLRTGYELLNGVLSGYASKDLSKLRADAPVFESVYRILRERKQDDYAVSGVLAVLSEAGYLVVRSYAVRYGEEAIAVHRRLLRFDLARCLRRFVGARLALLMALGCAGVSLWFRRGRARTLPETVQDAILAAASVAGAAAVGLDPAGVARCASAIEPLRALGENHAATAAYELVSNLIPMLRDRPARTTQVARAFLAKMNGPIRHLPGPAKAELEAGALTVLGRMELLRDDDACLAIASRLEQYGAISAMNADLIRACFHATQGNAELAGSFFKRLESHALQLGTSLQVEAWSAAPASLIALRLADASMMKNAALQLERLSREIPTLTRFALQTRGMYLLLCRDYLAAIEAMESDRELPAVGWTRLQGALAQAYNALGRHAEARIICLAAIEKADPEDFEFVAQNLNTEIQLALAEAGLGEHELASQRLDELLVRHTPRRGPVTLGALHLARARVALRAGDRTRAREHVAAASTFYRQTGATGLIEQVSAVRREIARGENSDAPSSSDQALAPHRNLAATIRTRLGRTRGRPLEERARQCLELVLEETAADDGFVVLAAAHGPVVVSAAGESPGPDLVGWVLQNIRDCDVDDQTLSVDAAAAATDPSTKRVGPLLYRTSFLRLSGEAAEQVIGAIALGFVGPTSRLPEAYVLRVVADHLTDWQGTGA